MDPEVLIELVVVVVEVNKGDVDEVLVTVVVAPSSNAGRDGDDVTLANPVDLLVLVSSASSHHPP